MFLQTAPAGQAAAWGTGMKLAPRNTCSLLACLSATAGIGSKLQEKGFKLDPKDLVLWGLQGSRLAGCGLS